VTLVNQAGKEKPIIAPTYESVHTAFFERDGSHHRGDWYITSLAEPGRRTQFRGGLGQFFALARMEGL
jgi:hypothetical protein